MVLANQMEKMIKMNMCFKILTMKKDWKTKNKKSLDFSRMKNKVVTNIEKDYMDKYRNIIKELRQRLFKLRGNV